MRTVTRLPGMSDISQESWQRKRELQDSLAELIGSYGYRRLETPVLEPTELFLRKSGGELASRLYSFTDAKSNAVSLRPEFTSPIMRHYLENRDTVDLPARWQYAGPVFRCEDEDAASGQFTQVGAELLGASSVLADVELLSLAARIPAHVGLTGCQLKVSDLDVVHSVLDAVGISDRAKSFIVGAVSSLREGRQAVPAVLERAASLHVMDQEGEEVYLGQAIAGLDDQQSRKVILGLMQWSSAGQLGQRDPDEVVERLLRKIKGGDDRESLRRALVLVSDLAGINGGAGDALPRIRAVVSDAGAGAGALDRFQEFMELASSEPEVNDSVVIDLSLVRGLAYYNGLLFDVTHPGQSDALGGGGRYDGLARALGADHSLPALGFAFNLDSLLSLLYPPGEQTEESASRPAALVRANAPSANKNAIRAAQELRREGKTVELDVSGQSADDAMALANRRGIPEVISVDESGRQTRLTARSVKV